MEKVTVQFDIPADCAYRLARFPKGEKALAHYLGSDTADDEPDTVTMREALLNWIKDYRDKT